MSKRYVYFIKPIGMAGPIKIGCSSKPAERLLKLSIWSPFPLEIIGTFPGWTEQEVYLQSRFAGQHSHKEWFHSSDLLLRTIDRILSGESLESACAGMPAKPNECKFRKARGRPPRRLKKDVLPDHSQFAEPALGGCAALAPSPHRQREASAAAIQQVMS